MEVLMHAQTVGLLFKLRYLHKTSQAYLTIFFSCIMTTVYDWLRCKGFPLAYEIQFLIMC